MTKKQEIQFFEEKKVRTVWDSETEQWYFCVVDVVEALTDSVNPSDYIKKMKKRDPSLAEGWGQIVTPFLCRPKEANKGLTVLHHKVFSALSSLYLHQKQNRSKSGWRRGGSVAKAARKQLESKTGKSAISASKASDYLLPTEDEKE